MALFEIPEPVNMNDLDSIQEWAHEEGIQTDLKETSLGNALIFNDKLALIPSPNGSSSQELRDLQKDFKNKGKSLFYVYPWEKDSHKLLPHFKSKIGLDTRKFAAKRLDIQEISNKDANDFMKKHHIQGSASGVGKVNIALLAKNTHEVLAVQQFSRYRFGILRGKGSVAESPVWEGLRLCFKPDVQIHGGASRLQKYFEKHYNPEKIISYINLSHSDGIYKASQGFTDITDWDQLSYMWVLSTSNPIDVKIIDKNGNARHPDLDKVLKTPYISPTTIAGAFGKGIGRTFFHNEKIGSRKQLGAHPENGDLIHNDAIIEAIGYQQVFTSGQAKWVKIFE